MLPQQSGLGGGCRGCCRYLTSKAVSLNTSDEVLTGRLDIRGHLKANEWFKVILLQLQARGQETAVAATVPMA
jgi:hypothetical protein